MKYMIAFSRVKSAILFEFCNRNKSKRDRYSCAFQCSWIVFISW